jgi:hypothetical protein
VRLIALVVEESVTQLGRSRRIQAFQDGATDRLQRFLDYAVPRSFFYR